jgi:malate synthase
VQISRPDLLKVHSGARTEHGMRENIRVGVQYIEAWLRGRGAVPLYNLMEDAATAEISRAQLWQWIKSAASLDDGRTVTAGLFKTLLDEEMEALRQTLSPGVYDGGRFAEAISLFADMTLSDSFEEFLTLPAYEALG